jgi:hypothetical protein
LLPVTAYATPADPAVEAYREWRAAYDARDASLEADVEDDTPEGQVLFDRVQAARLALSDAVATTSAGLAYLGMRREKMVKQLHEMTDDELFGELRGAEKGSAKYARIFPEVEIRQAIAQIKSAKATSRSALWVFITMVIIGVTNAVLIYLQIK